MFIGVTGCAGYVGNVVCRDLLAKGYEVRGFDNLHKRQCDALLSVIDNPNFEFMSGDITNVNDIEKFTDCLSGAIHLAAIVGLPACKKQPELSKIVNVKGTENILLSDPYLPLVFASTGSVYGELKDGLCSEESPRNPLSVYGITKMQAEDLVTQAANTVSFRFATGCGVSPCMRVNLLVNDLVHKALTERSINIFQPDFKRTFISVKDMSNVFIWGLESLFNNTLKYKVYNAGDDSLNWSKRELAEYIKQKTGCYVTYNESGTDGDFRNYEVDYSRLNNAGFKCNISMETILDELIKCVPLMQMRNPYE